MFVYLHLTVSEIEDFICKTQEYCKQSKQKWFIVKKSNELQHWKIQSGFKSLFWSQGIVSLRWVIPKKWLNTYNCWNIGQIRHRCPTSWFTFFVRKGRPWMMSWQPEGGGCLRILWRQYTSFCTEKWGEGSQNFSNFVTSFMDDPINSNKTYFPKQSHHFKGARYL